MHARKTTKLLAGAAASAVLTMGGAQAAPSIAITSPQGGVTVSRADETMLVTGTAAFDAPSPKLQNFFLRGSGCGATQSFWLSVESGSDEYDGCGTIGGLPVNEVLYQAGGAPSTFSAQDGVPVMIDASKDLKGQIRAESWTGPGTPGAGQVVVEVAISGADADGNSFVLGSDTVEAVNTAADGVVLPFSFNLADDLQGVVLTELSLNVEVHGANYNSSNLGLEGDSKFTLPVLDAGTVQVSESPAFSATKTVRALVAADGTWTAEIPVPAVGARKIHARAIQGSAATAATPVAIQVVA